MDGGVNVKRDNDKWKVVYGKDPDISDIKEVKDLESYIKWNIGHLAQCMVEENRTYIESGYIQAQYNRIFHQLVKAMGDLPNARLLKEYEALLIKEDNFFDPYEAYLAGGKYRRLLVISNKEAYGYYLSDIRKKDEYQNAKRDSEQLFYRIMSVLKTEELRSSFIELTQLYGNVHGILRKKIKVFFDLGFDGAITDLDQEDFAALLSLGHSNY